MKPSGPTFDKSWRATCEVVRVERREVEHMVRRHYLGKWPGVCVLVLALKRHSELLGMVVFALPPRETSKRYGGETWELARLWIDDAVPVNAETWFIARAIKYVRHHHPNVKCLA